MSDFKEMIDFFGHVRQVRTCKKTNKYGGEVVRINQNARTRQSKRALLSYAVYLLYKEFVKWTKGDQETEFGYDEEVIEDGE